MGPPRLQAAADERAVSSSTVVPTSMPAAEEQDHQRLSAELSKARRDLLHIMENDQLGKTVKELPEVLVEQAPPPMPMAGSAMAGSAMTHHAEDALDIECLDDVSHLLVGAQRLHQRLARSTARVFELEDSLKVSHESALGQQQEAALYRQKVQELERTILLSQSDASQARIHAQEVVGNQGVLQMTNQDLSEQMGELRRQNAHLEAMLRESRSQTTMAQDEIMMLKTADASVKEVDVGLQVERKKLLEMNSLLEQKISIAEKEKHILGEEVNRIKSLGAAEITELRAQLEQARALAQNEQGNFVELMGKAHDKNTEAFREKELLLQELELVRRRAEEESSRMLHERDLFVQERDVMVTRLEKEKAMLRAEIEEGKAKVSGERDRILEVMRQAEMGIAKLEQEKELLGVQLRDCEHRLEEDRRHLTEENHRVTEVLERERAQFVEVMSKAEQILEAQTAKHHEEEEILVAKVKKQAVDEMQAAMDSLTREIPSIVPVPPHTPLLHKLYGDSPSAARSYTLSSPHLPPPMPPPVHSGAYQPVATGWKYPEKNPSEMNLPPQLSLVPQGDLTRPQAHTLPGSSTDGPAPDVSSRQAPPESTIDSQQLAANLGLIPPPPVSAPSSEGAPSNLGGTFLREELLPSSAQPSPYRAYSSGNGTVAGNMGSIYIGTGSGSGDASTERLEALVAMTDQLMASRPGGASPMLPPISLPPNQHPDALGGSVYSYAVQPHAVPTSTAPSASPVASDPITEARKALRDTAQVMRSIVRG